MMRAMLTALFCGMLMLLGANSAHAHKGSDAYLEVQQIGDATVARPVYRDIRFVLAVAIKDLDLALPVDANADGKVTWGEIKAVTPQVLPLLWGYTIYMFEYNIRAASILGVVGAGGIGFELVNYMRGFEYQKATTMGLVLLIVVIAIDLLSSNLRKRLESRARS